ncbi:MAG: hypothetical protein ABJC79_10900 [Acidimicrobiia bacterium]
MRGSTRARRLARGARRLADGARGLGVGTSAHWLISRAGHRPVPTVNTSMTWCRADESTTTLVWLHNYWSDAYDIDSPHLNGHLVALDGATLASFDVDLASDATVAIDVRARCTEHGVVLPFEGELLLEFDDERLAPNRPVQVFAEYVRDDGECTGVHGQYGLVATPAAQVVSAIRVEARAGYRTGFVVTNAYAGPGAPASMRPEITLLAADGRSWHARLDAIPSRGTRVVYADDVFPDAAGLLAGAAGHARVKLACPSSRVATFVEHPDDHRLVVNHGTVDRVFDQGVGIDPSWTRSWPVASVLGTFDARRDTVLTLPNVWGPHADDYDVVIDLYRPDGTHLTRHHESVAKDHLRELSLRDLVDSDPVPYVHAEVQVLGNGPAGERPHTFDVLAGFVDDGELAAEVQIGADFYNADVPDGVQWMDLRRTRIFGRVRSDDMARTKLFLAQPVGTTGWTTTARPLLTLISADGTRRSTTEVELAPHGCLLADVTELFDDAHEILGPSGCGAVRVRDTTARLYGFYWVERPGARTLPLCHLIGG